MVKHFEEMAAIADATGVCKNTYNNMEVLESWRRRPALLTAATGLTYHGEDVRQIGERIVNLERLFNAREGISRTDDTLPHRFLHEPLPDSGGASDGAVLELEPMLDGTTAPAGGMCRPDCRARPSLPNSAWTATEGTEPGTSHVRIEGIGQQGVGDLHGGASDETGRLLRRARR